MIFGGYIYNDRFTKKIVKNRKKKNKLEKNSKKYENNEK